MNTESYSQGASIFSSAGGGAGKLAEEQPNTASASTMSKYGQPSIWLQQPQDCPTNFIGSLHFGSEGPQHWNGCATYGLPLQGSCIPSICHKSVAHGVCST